MPRSAISRAAFLLVLVLVAVPALQAAPTRAEAAPAPSAWGFLAQVWDFLTGIWSANGCEADPSGRCQPRPTTVEIDNGCEADPNGRCGN